MQQTNQSILKKSITDFQQDYSPYYEWLILYAYTLSTTLAKPKDALVFADLLDDEHEIVTHLIDELAIYQFNIKYYLINELGVSLEVAENCENNIAHILKIMLEYYEQVYDKIDTYYQYKFFDSFEYLHPDATDAFCQLVWGYTSAKAAVFAKNLIIDYYYKNNLPLPEISKLSNVKYTPEDVKGFVINELLIYFAKSPITSWSTVADDPTSINKCPHTSRIVLRGREWVCDLCGEVKVDLNKDIDEYDYEWDDDPMASLYSI